MTKAQTGQMADGEDEKQELSDDQVAGFTQRKAQGLKMYREHYSDLTINTSLFTPEQAQEIEAEIGNYSITPKTFQSRTFFSEVKEEKADEAAAEQGAKELEASGSGAEQGVSGSAASSDSGTRSPIAARVEKTISQVKSRIEGLDSIKNEFTSKVKELKDCVASVVPKGKLDHATSEVIKLTGDLKDQEVHPLQQYKKELSLFENFVEKNSSLILTYKDVYENGNGNSVTRFGINVAGMTAEQAESLANIYTKALQVEGSVRSGGSSKKNKQDDSSQSKMMHPLEVFVIQDAIDHLNAGNKTVLVDIFARDNDNSIRQEDGKPETHSVVLYKTADQIIIIDPSDPNFSRHIAFNNVRLFREGEGYTEIISPLREKIYTPVRDNTGPGPDQFRDCIDIAVKLAFGLNKLEEDITAEAIMSSDVVKEVTNRSKLDIDFPYDMDARGVAELPSVRVKQSSDDGIRNAFNTINQKIQFLLKLLPRLSIAPTERDDGLDVGDQYDFAMRRVDDYKNILFDRAEGVFSLLTVYDEIYEELLKGLQEQQTCIHAFAE